MAYQTSNGTITAMVAALASFALANGWSAPTAPAAKNYWRVVWANSSYTDAQARTGFKNLDMRDGSSVSVGLPDTVLSSGGQTGFEDGFSNTGFLSSSTDDARQHWVGGQWNSAVNVREISIEFDTSIDGANSREVHPLSLVLEWSDDGTTWTTFSVFNTGGINVNNTTVVYTHDPTSWPLTPGDDLLFNIALQQPDDLNADRVRLKYSGTTSENMYPGGYFLSMAKGNMEINRFQDYCVFDYTPEDQSVAEWHFFADTTVSNYIHCAFRMTDEGTPRWFHWSMGIINNKGLSHHGVGYVIGDKMSFYQDHSTNSSQAHRWRSLRNGNPMVRSQEGTDISQINEVNACLWYFLDSGGSGYAVPDDGDWPARGIVHNGPDFGILNCNAGSMQELGSIQLDPATSFVGGFDQCAINGTVHPVSGYLTLGTMPVFCSAGLEPNDLVCYLGEIPDMRFCRVDNLSDGGEVTQDVNTWKTFPRLRKTDIAEMNITTAITSGPAGYAYRRV